MTRHVDDVRLLSHRDESGFRSLHDRERQCAQNKDPRSSSRPLANGADASVHSLESARAAWRRHQRTSDSSLRELEGIAKQGFNGTQSETTALTNVCEPRAQVLEVNAIHLEEPVPSLVFHSEK